MTLGIEYSDTDWPHGLRCADCERVLLDGDRYSERLIGLEPIPCNGPGTCDAWPVTEIVCLRCAL